MAFKLIAELHAAVQDMPLLEVADDQTFERFFGELEDLMNGEETECAIRIDGHANVKRGLRNAKRITQGGFSLPKSPGQFFPDFIVELNDGRIVLVEYKNGKLASHPDEQQKKDIGELGAARSDRGHRFGWIVDKDWRSLDLALADQKKD